MQNRTFTRIALALVVAAALDEFTAPAGISVLFVRDGAGRVTWLS